MSMVYTYILIYTWINSRPVTHAGVHAVQRYADTAYINSYEPTYLVLHCLFVSNKSRFRLSKTLSSVTIYIYTAVRVYIGGTQSSRARRLRTLRTKIYLAPRARAGHQFFFGFSGFVAKEFVLLPALYRHRSLRRRILHLITRVE